MRKDQSFRRALLALALVAAAVAAQARSSWKIDPSQTHVVFWVDAIGWPRTAGEFKSFDGRIDIDFDGPSRSRADFRVAAKSVDVSSPSMDDCWRPPEQAPAIGSVKRGWACRARAIQVAKGASMFAIPFGVNMNESLQFGAGLALETRYRTIARLNGPLGRPI